MCTVWVPYEGFGCCVYKLTNIHVTEITTCHEYKTGVAIKYCKIK